MSALAYDKLRLLRFPDRQAMARAASDHVREVIAAARAARGVARVIFACAPSQNEFLNALTAPPPTLPWGDVIVFHMEEYVGLSASQHASVRHYLRTHLLDGIPAPRAVHSLRGEAPSLPEECLRYSRLLRERPIDLVCLSIGECGQLAANSQSIADFDDREMVKVAELPDQHRQQAVNDGCFARASDVPTHALTLTVPALFSARVISCVVPGLRKAKAVRDTLLGLIDESCPASILRTHPDATLHVDEEAASLLP